ncbi:MAG TPA: hypothetical protein VFU40_12065, partial [Gemmatimonadales bacterium]|nr:hypothetical protein [Gemmatimonadales bacterium]
MSRPALCRFSLIAAVLVMGSGCTGTSRRGEVIAAPAGPGVCERGGSRSAGGPVVSPAVLGRHVRFLADDSLRGRGTGTPGFDLAARYVAGCFTDLGLEAAGTQGYMQPVPLRQARALEGS